MAVVMTGRADRRPLPADMHQTALRAHDDDDDDDSRLSVDVTMAHSR